MIKSGIKPKGKISIVHADKDPLANSEKSLMISKFFDKSQFTLKVINSSNHVFEQNPEEQFLAIDATLRIN